MLSGVSQGTVIGPLLFLIYINDLPDNISRNVCLLASDCVIYRKLTIDSDLLTLPNDVQAITNWCKTWQMFLNPIKRRYMLFSHSSLATILTLLLNGTPLEFTNQYKYLGLHLLFNLIWNTHIDKIRASANRSLGYIRRNFKSAPTNLKRLLYVTLVCPKLEYASVIWNPSQETLTNSIESVQNRTARFILSDYSRVSSVTIMKSNLNLSPFPDAVESLAFPSFIKSSTHLP